MHHITAEETPVTLVQLKMVFTVLDGKSLSPIDYVALGTSMHYVT